MNDSEKIKQVWKWKEDVFDKTRNMSREERIRFYNAGIESFAKKTGVQIVIKKAGKNVAA